MAASLEDELHSQECADAVQNYFQSIASARRACLQQWQKDADIVAGHRQDERVLTEGLRKWTTARTSLLERYSEFAYAPRRTTAAAAASSGLYDPDRFDHLLTLAGAALGAARQQFFKGSSHKQARRDLDSFQLLLDQLLAEQNLATQDLEESIRHRDERAAAVAASWRVSVAGAADALQTAWNRQPAPLQPYSSGAWASWAAGDQVELVMAGTLRPLPDPQLGPNHNLGCEATAPYLLPCRTNLTIGYDSERRDAAHELLRSLLLRMLTALPPGRARLSVYDPVGLGQSVANLLELLQYDPVLLDGKVWSDPHNLRERLGDLTNHIELVIQKYLRAEYRSIDEYNAEVGAIAEPYRFLILVDYPNGLDADLQHDLNRIMENGPRCGVYTILVRDTAPRSANDTSDAVQSAPSGPVINLAGPISVATDGYSLELSFTADSLGTHNSEFTERIIDSVGRTAQGQSEAVVPFDTAFGLFYEECQRAVRPELRPLPQFVDARDSKTWWSCDTTRQIAAPIGQRGARESAVLRFDSVDNAGALLIGRPGSGKSTLLHTYIAGLTTLYGPDELELYLVDFKEGVEFKAYAEHGLPHARCVATETDREFGLSVLKSIDAEITRRSEILRGTGGDHSSLQSLREATGEPLPRVLLIFDEFQALFAQNDRIGLAAADLLEPIIRQGRGFGVHVLLASQSLSGLDGLGAHVPQLLPVRVLLAASDLDAHRVLGEGNDAGQYLTHHGEAILNEANGAVEANQLVHVALLDEGARSDRLAQLRRLADDRQFTRRPIVFEGAAAASFEQVSPAEWHEITSTLSPTVMRLRQGAAMTLGGTVDIDLKRESGANVLLVSRSAEAGNASAGTPHNLAICAATCAASQGAQVRVLDFTSVDDGFAEVLSDLTATSEAVSVHRRRDLPQLLSDLVKEVELRQSADDSRAVPHLLIIVGMHRARDFDEGNGDLGDEESPGALLAKLLLDGPESGVHTWVWAETMASVERRLPYQSLREFSWRIAGRMSSEDSQKLLGSEDAARLRGQQLVITNDDIGVENRCLAYAAPTREWLDSVFSQTRGDPSEP